ncbi:hypothetical protein V6Z77_003406 [Aspergillus fumigatus]
MPVLVRRLSPKQCTKPECSRSKTHGGRCTIRFNFSPLQRELTQILWPRDADFFIWNCVELNVGIVAACFPTIKPLVKSVIGSTWSYASNSRSRKRTNNAYYGQSSSHALGSIRRSGLEHEAQKYNVHVDGVRISLSASEGGSEEHLAAHPQAQRLSSTRILRTTEVIVHTDGGSDAVGPGIGPKQTVDDRV